jgi:hypothetical protein
MPKRERKPESAASSAPAKKSKAKDAAATEKPKRARKSSGKPVPANDFPEATPAVGSIELPDDKTTTEEMIRITAYQKWEAAGKPPGEEMRFWLEAEQALMNGK